MACSKRFTVPPRLCCPARQAVAQGAAAEAPDMRRVRQTASTVAKPIRRAASTRKPCPHSRGLESPTVRRDLHSTCSPINDRSLYERSHALCQEKQPRVRPLLHRAPQRGAIAGEAREGGTGVAVTITSSPAATDAGCFTAWSRVSSAGSGTLARKAGGAARGNAAGRGDTVSLATASLSSGRNGVASLPALTPLAVGTRAAVVGMRAHGLHTTATRRAKSGGDGGGDEAKPSSEKEPKTKPTEAEGAAAAGGAGGAGGKDGGGRLATTLGGKGEGKGDAPETKGRAAAAVAAAAGGGGAPSAASSGGRGGAAEKGGGVGANASEGAGSGGGSGGGGGVVGDLPHQVSEIYVDLERKLMSRVHAQDKNRFRAVGLSSTLLMIWVLSMFGTEIRKYFASQTAEVARETLKVEALQVQTQELATALVQALLNDQEVVSAGALFLREASANPETQGALISLALYVLLHPDTLAETKVLAKKLVRAVLDDPDTVQQVTDMALKVMRNPRFRQGASELVVALGQSQEVYLAVTDLASRVIQDPEVQATLSVVLSASSREVLQDQEVFDHSKEFVAQVMGDDAVQRSGGDALWNTMQYALQTRLFKATGLCILAAGTAVLLSGKGSGRDFGGWGGGGGGSK